MLKSILKAGAIGFLGTLSLGSVIESEMEKYNTDDIQPVDTVSIVIPSYNESAFVGTSLSSIKNQSIIQRYPEYFEIILADSCSTDGTIQLAEPFVDRIIITPRGKLTARNIATSEARGNIIVSVDADSYYPFFWLNTLLEPFKDPYVVGVYGSTFDNNIPFVPGKIFSFGDAFYNTLFSKNRMTGRNSAFRKREFYLAGKFNENINQFQIWSIFNEEEKLFGNRLSKFGKIVYNINASCYHLGGAKSAGRLGIGNKQNLEKYQFGTDRF